MKIIERKRMGQTVQFPIINSLLYILVIFRNSFLSAHSFGFKHAKINVFTEKREFIEQRYMWLQTGLADLKKTFEISFREVFTHFLKYHIFLDL